MDGLPAMVRAVSDRIDLHSMENSETAYKRWLVPL